jgi:hypothetical protein
VDRLIRPDGLYLMNVIDYDPLRFARAETATLRSVFGHVAVIAGASPLGPGAGGNLVLLASHEPIDAAGIAARTGADDGTAAILSLPEDIDAFTAGAPLLTDDFAPVDQLLAR